MHKHFNGVKAIIYFTLFIIFIIIYYQQNGTNEIYKHMKALFNIDYTHIGYYNPNKQKSISSIKSWQDLL